MTIDKENPITSGPTINDVASLAGVAASTVSRTFTHPNRVNIRTRKRVQQAAAELRYVSRTQIGAAIPDRRNAIALLVPDITNPFYFDIIRGTQMQVAAAGYMQLLVDTEESSEVEMESIERLHGSADGVILAASRLSDDELSQAAVNFPIVAINRQVPGVASVIIDTPSGVIQALDHLASLGHRKIAYISGPKDSWSNIQRWLALENRANELDLDLLHVGNFAPKITSGAAAADAAVACEASACLVFNDLIAIGMLKALATRGIEVPREMSIIGCDDIFGADFCDPPLTTLTAPIEQVGRVAIAMLLARLKQPSTGASAQFRSMPTHLTVRESTAPTGKQIR